MTYQTYQGQPQPAPQKASSGAKTCLILGLSGVALLALLMIVGVVGIVMLGRTAMKAAQEQRDARMAELGISPDIQTPSAPRIKIEDIDSPKSVTEAIAMLNRSEWQYHEVAAKWLKDQPLDSSQQSRVSAALVKKSTSGPSSTRSAAMDAFEKWAHPDAAGDFADSLRPNQDGNARRLQILAKLRRPESAEKIAALLESAVDGPEALTALKAIGEDSVPYLLPLLTSSKPLAVKYANELLEHFDVDVDQAQARRFAAMLNDEKPFNNDDAFRGLMGLTVIPELQQEISVQLSAALDQGGFNAEDVLKAIEKWGDASCVEAVNRYLAKETFLDNHPALFSTINKLDDDSTIPILISRLVDFGSPPKRIADCLIEYGDRAAPEVVKLLNHKDDNVQLGVTRFLGAVDVDESLMIDQCLIDLKQSEQQVVSNAFKWMNEIDPDEIEITAARRNEIASAMGVGVENAYFTKREQAARTFCNWATETQAPKLIELLENNDEKVWKPALEKLVGFNNPDLSARPVAGMLTNFFKREKTISVLRDAGPDVEDLAIVLVGGLEDDEALYEACDLLARYGGEKSLIPLNDLTKRATRAGGNDGKKIAAASKEAIQIIKERLAAERNGDDGDGSMN